MEQGSDVGEVGQQPGDALEEPQPAARVPCRVRTGAQQPVDRGMRGQSGGEAFVVGEDAEDLGEGEVRQTDVTQVDAVPGEDRHPGGRGPPRDLVQDPGLADARVPGDQHRSGRTRAGALQHTGEAGEFLVPADERCCCHG